jgi:hypothetical protein
MRNKTVPINQFEVLYNSYPKQGAGDVSLNVKGIVNPSTDKTFDIYRQLAIKSITPDIFKDSKGAIKTGYILRAGESTEDLHGASSAVGFSNNDRIARCMIVDGYETEALAYPETYDEDYTSTAIISSYPSFRYPASWSGDIIRGAFVKVQFFGGTLQHGFIQGIHDIPPVTLATKDLAESAHSAFEFGGDPKFLHETVISSPPTTDTNLRNTGFVALGERQISPMSTYAIPEDYFHPSRFKKSLARAVGSLDDAVKIRFARGIKKFIVQQFDNGLDVKMSFGYRSRSYQNYLWRAQHEGIINENGERVFRTTGAVRGGNSWHNYGVAGDFLVWEEGRSSASGHQEDGGWFDEEGTAGSAYHQEFRRAMLSEGIYNPLDGVQSSIKDPGHFQPVELPAQPPADLRNNTVAISQLLRDTDSSLV